MTDKYTAYQGNCHCGSYRFELRLSDLRALTTCDCDLCKKQGYLWTVPPIGAFSITRDDGKMVDYKTNTLNHRVSMAAIHKYERDGSEKIVLSRLWNGSAG